MANYYFLITLLPPLSFSHALNMTLTEFNELLNENLTFNDIQKINSIRRYFDFFSLQTQGSFQHHGSDDGQAAEKINYFSENMSTFFREEIKRASPFFKKYLEFEHALHLIFLAFRAKRMRKDLIKEIKSEDFQNSLVIHILDQKDSSDYEPPEPYKELKAFYQYMCHDPLALFQAINEYRFNKVGEMVEGYDPFSIESLAGYFIQFFLVLGWQSLDKAKGLQVVEQILKGTKS